MHSFFGYSLADKLSPSHPLNFGWCRDMVKPKAVPVLSPTLEPVKAIPVLEGLISRAEQLRAEAWTSPARQQWSQTGESALIAALGSAHPNVHAFTTAQCGAYGPYDTDEYLMEQANTQLDGMLAILRSTVEQLRWHLPDATQVFLPAGSHHDAYIEIRKIVQNVASELLIVDSYVDGTLWSLLTNVAPSVKIRIMTMQMKQDFALEARKFVAQHGAVIEIRQTAQYHDRFIVLDASRCWHLGASIKDAGNKAFAMSEVVSATIRAAISADIEATWNRAQQISI